MKKYRSIDLDYGVNTALIDAYKAMQREMELQEDEDEDMEDIVPVMETDENAAAAEEFAEEAESGMASADDGIEWE